MNSIEIPLDEAKFHLLGGGMVQAKNMANIYKLMGIQLYVSHDFCKSWKKLDTGLDNWKPFNISKFYEITPYLFTGFNFLTKLAQGFTMESEEGVRYKFCNEEKCYKHCLGEGEPWIKSDVKINDLISRNYMHVCKYL